MKRHAPLVVSLLAALLFTSGCQISDLFGTGEEADARTYYESLDLDSPESAVQTFTDAFQRGDFMTVHLVLDGKSQLMLRMEQGRDFNWDHLIGELASDRLYEHVSFADLRDVHVDFWYTFDRLMLRAAEFDDFLIDLRGELEILRSEDSLTGDGRQAVDIIAAVDGVQGEVIFRTVLEADDRWRIYLVSAPEEGVDSWPSTMLIESQE